MKLTAQQFDALHDSYQRQIVELTAERDTLRAELEAQTSRAAMWKARCNHGTDASELQPGEEAYERLRAERDALRSAVEADVIVRTMHHPDGRVETYLASDQAAQLRSLREAAEDVSERMKGDTYDLRYVINRLDAELAKVAECHAADNRPDVCFARGFKQGRDEAQEAHEAQLADNGRLRAELGLERRFNETMAEGQLKLDADNERLKAELAHAKSDACYADKWANRYKDRLTELRELCEAAEACVVRGSEPHLYYPPSPTAIGALRAVLAKVAP